MRDVFAAIAGWTIVVPLAILTSTLLYNLAMFSSAYLLPVLGFLVTHGSGQNVNLNWYAPNATQINNLTSAVNGTGVYGFVFNGSYVTPAGNDYYGGYNW